MIAAMGTLLTTRLAWLSLFCVLVHVVLPFTHAAHAAAGIPLVVCSAQGNYAAPGPAPDKSSLATPVCPLCLAGTHLDMVSGSHHAVAPLRHASYAFSFATPTAPTQLSRLLHFSSRAPPA